MLYALFRYVVLGVFKILYRVRFEGVEHCPKSGGYIYASNHRSYYDPIFLSLPVKKRFCYMAKEELFTKNKLFGWFIRILGAFPVSRGKGDMEVIETAVAKLDSGKNLVIFPEGTRSYDGRVARGKSGVALIAAKSNRDVIPCAIVFEGAKLKLGKPVTVRFGEMIKTHELALTDEHSANPKELKRVKGVIMTAITALAEKDMPPRVTAGETDKT